MILTKNPSRIIIDVIFNPLNEIKISRDVDNKTTMYIWFYIVNNIGLPKLELDK